MADRGARDSQRSAIYAWERRLPGWPGGSLSLGECQALVCQVWGDHLSTDAPLVMDGRGRRRACFVPELHQIRLPRSARTVMIVLHETAHGMLWAHDPGLAHHGPEFARLYLTLLYRYAGVQLSRARSLAVHLRPRRVHFAGLDTVPTRLPREQRGPARVYSPKPGRLLF